MLMVNGLILLGVIALYRVGVLNRIVGVSAVLGQTDDLIRVFRMELIEELIVLLQLANVPAVVQVVGTDIRHIDQRGIRLQHKQVGHGGHSGGIHLVGQIVKDHMVLHQVVGHTGQGNLVGQRPADDGGMVIILSNQLRHLIDGILTAIGHMHGDVGDLRPGNQAFPVAELIEILIVLIVGQTDRVGSHGEDDVHILLVHLPGQRIAHASAVLMTGYAVQRITSSVQEKSFLRVETVGPASEPGIHLIHLLAAAVKLRAGVIAVGIVQAIPEMHMVDADNRLRVPLALAVIGYRHRCLPDTRDLKGYRVRLSGHVSLQFHVRVTAVHLGRDLEAVSPIIIQIKMGRLHGNQIHVTVDTAVECKIRSLGIYMIVLAVVRDDRQHILLRQPVGQIRPEGGISAVVGRHGLTV